MFQKYYFYYRLFWLNKLNNSRRTFSCWPIPPSTFAGSQILQIKNRNYYWQLPCLFQPQKFCQHNLFHNGGNVRDYHPLPINEANSSSTIQSPKMPTNNAMKQNKQQQNSVGRETEKPVDNHGYLEKRFLQLDIYNKKQFGLALKKGRSGQKTFETKLYMPDKFVYFDNILVPQDAYSFVRALDELIGELTTENFEQKLHNIKAPQSIVGGRPQLKRELKLRNVLFTGREHQFQLELVLFINAENKGGKMEKRICLRLLAINKINMKKSLTLPLKALPWMRKQMAEMLTKHDGTEQIETETLAKIPKQLQMINQFFPKNETHNFRPITQNGPSFGGKLEKKNSQKNLYQFDESRNGKNLANMERGLLKELSAEILELKKEIRGLKREINDVFRAPPVPNGIYSGRRLAQNGNRQQFVNQQYSKMANKIARNFNQSGYKKQKQMFTPLSVQQRRSNSKKLDPKIAALEGGIQTLFDFDDEDMENYRRIAAKIEHPSTEH